MPPASSLFGPGIYHHEHVAEQKKKRFFFFLLGWATVQTLSRFGKT
jgi:hypothetical protein